MINAINFATRNCEVSIGLKADASAKVCFVTAGWQLDIGYNVFFQEAEKVCIKTDARAQSILAYLLLKASKEYAQCVILFVWRCGSSTSSSTHQYFAAQ